jgi:hypothetical protein
LTLTSVILAFLIIVLSIQTKIGIKVNIIVDRLGELWNGPSVEKQKQGVRVKQPTGPRHVPSQADYVDNSQIQNDMFPPAPMATAKQNETYDHMIRGSGQQNDFNSGPLPANSIVGGSFGSSF